MRWSSEETSIGSKLSWTGEDGLKVSVESGPSETFSIQSSGPNLKLELRLTPIQKFKSVKLHQAAAAKPSDNGGATDPASESGCFRC